MHVSDENLKVLIDVLAERLDDDLDMMSDVSWVEERESAKDGLGGEGPAREVEGGAAKPGSGVWRRASRRRREEVTG